MATKQLTAALKLAEERNLRFVSLQFTDITGHVKSVQVPMHQLEPAVEQREVVRRLEHRGLRAHRRDRHVPRPGPVDVRADPWEPG